MTIIEIEKEVDVTSRWLPCIICETKTDCKCPCLRFNAYVSTDAVRNRYKQFKRFAEKNGIEL